MYSVGNAEAADRRYNHFTLFGVRPCSACSSGGSERIRTTISFTRCPLWFVAGRTEACRAGPCPHRASRCPVRLSGHRSSAPALLEASCSARNGSARRRRFSDERERGGRQRLLQHAVPSRWFWAGRERELRFRQAFLTAAGRSAAAGSRTPSGEGVLLQPTGSERLSSAAPLAVPALLSARPGHGAGT